MPGSRVSEVARRWQVCPQQVFAWRHAARCDVAAMPREPASQPVAGFVPIITEATPPVTSVPPIIEVTLAGAVVRVGSGMDDCHVDGGDARGARLGVAAMINVPAGARILLATRPVDFRKGAHGLAALASQVLAEDPFSGAVIVCAPSTATGSRFCCGTPAGSCWLEAIAAGLVPLAADHGRGDEAVAGRVCRVVRWARLDACSDHKDD